MDATRFGFVMMLAYPPLVLAYDAGLILAGRRAISCYVWSNPTLRHATCAYLVLLCLVLVVHFYARWPR